METKNVCEFNRVRRKKEVQFIIDLNIDCLEYICKFLSLKELLRLAHSNKQLKAAAELAFSGRYGNMDIQLKKLTPRYYCFDSVRCVPEYNYIEISGLRLSLQTIRCFGHLIKILTIRPYIDIVARWPFILLIRYVQKYCSKSLTDISIIWNKEIPVGCLEHLNKAFPKVKIVRICDRYVGKNRLNKLFPNMESLRYDRFNKVLGLKSIKNHFPNLVQLEIGSFLKYASDVHRETIATALSLNPQIQILSITYILDMQFIQIISDCLPHLKHLKLICESKNVMQYKDKTIRFKHVKKLDITLMHCETGRRNIYESYKYIPNSGPMPEIKISSFELEELVLYVVFQAYPIAYQCRHYFARNTIEARSDALKLTNRTVEKPLSSLTEIDFEYWCRRFMPQFYRALKGYK